MSTVTETTESLVRAALKAGVDIDTIYAWLAR